jgi:hypothetical protein
VVAVTVSIPTVSVPVASVPTGELVAPATVGMPVVGAQATANSTRINTPNKSIREFFFISTLLKNM